MAKKTPKVMLAVNQEPTANSQEPTAKSQQPTANNQEPTAKSQQPTANSQEPTAVPLPDTYDGLEWKEITERLIEQMGIYGEPKKGVNRNNTLYKLALQMMYLTDFNADALLAVLPDWGLGWDERRATVNSALKHRGTEMPPLVKSVIQELKRGEKEEETIEELNPMPQHMTRLFSAIHSYFGVLGRQAVLCALPILGAELTWCRAEYRNGELERPNLYVAVSGKFASGKSFIIKLFKSLGFPLIEADKQTAEEEREWQYQEKHTKSRKEAQGNKLFPYRTIAPKASNTELLKRSLGNGGQCLLQVCDEVAVLLGQKGNSWAAGTEARLKGFDGEGPWGQSYSSATSYSGDVELMLSLLYGGTEQGLSKLIPPAEVENGLASRFLFVKMPPTDGMPLRKRNRDDKRLELIRAEGQRMCETGSSPHVNEAFEIRLPRTNKALDAWDAEKIEDFKQSGNVAIDALRKRAALIGFRAAMIARCLEGRETKAVVDFGLWVAQEAFLSQMAYCGDEVQKADEINSRLARKSERTLRRSKNTRIFDELPEKFEKKDLQALRAKMGYGDKECSYILTRWQQDNRVRREGIWFFKH